MVFDNKFGMFIHWGIYAVPKLQEQAVARYRLDPKYKMTMEEYENLINVFNPVDYDPEEWVLQAKKAGMKYICFTTKHHDGFCMWDTKYTDYNIMNTPYGKDVLKMLADACEKHGMLLSLYYSNPDWHHPYGFNPNDRAGFQCLAKNREEKVDYYNYLKYIEYVKNQITELMTNYGKIYTLFWDIPPKLNIPEMNELVRKLQPGIFINDRGYGPGDFSTPERNYDSTEGKRFERMTEACNSVGEQSWGYREMEDYHSKRYLTCAIDKIMAMGGNYLLNIGPSPEGVLPRASLDVLDKVSDWYNRMEGCLEGHEPDTFEYKIQKYQNQFVVNKKNGKSYFHFYNGIEASSVAIHIYPNKPKSVRLMNTGEALPFEVELLPEYGTGKILPGLGEDHLHIWGIPIDDLSDEPVVLEIEW